jgi:hypothetical protein
MFSDTRSKPPSCAPEERAYIVGYGGDSLNVSDAVKATICALAATGYSRDRCEIAAGQLLINDGDRAFLATPVPDSDGDGIPDSQDQCPQSVISPTVVLGACDSGVPNVLAANGCTIVNNTTSARQGLETPDRSRVAAPSMLVPWYRSIFPVAKWVRFKAACTRCRDSLLFLACHKAAHFGGPFCLSAADPQSLANLDRAELFF